MASKITMLEAYALHGSCSYGEISPVRLKEIILGATPAARERPCVNQALLEMAAIGLYRDPAVDLASELGITLAQLEARCVELTGHKLGSSSHSHLGSGPIDFHLSA